MLDSRIWWQKLESAGWLAVVGEAAVATLGRDSIPHATGNLAAQEPRKRYIRAAHREVVVQGLDGLGVGLIGGE